MPKPAAALGDLAAHGGAVAIGSNNVFIGGKPAARQSDSVACSQHGTGIIATGSATVFINGRPAARMGDTTGCLFMGMGSLAIPPVLGVPAGAPPLTKSNDGQTNAEAEEKGKPTFFHIERTDTDEDHDGQRESFEGTGAFAHYSNRMDAPDRAEGKTGKERGAKITTDAVYFNVKSSGPTGPLEITNESREFGVAKVAVVLSGGDAGSKGAKPDNSTTIEGNFAHAKVSKDVVLGSDGRGRHGLLVNGELGAQVWSADVTQQNQKLISVAGYDIGLKTRKGFSALALGGAGGAWAYLGDNEQAFHLGFNEAIKAGLGEGVEMDLIITKTSKSHLPGLGMGSITGTILTGNVKVIIG